MSAFFLTWSDLETQRDHMTKQLRAARYWLGVTEANADGSALHRDLLEERQRRVARLEAECERLDDAIVAEFSS